jgi:hypothetical protein
MFFFFLSHSNNTRHSTRTKFLKLLLNNQNVEHEKATGVKKPHRTNSFQRHSSCTNGSVLMAAFVMPTAQWPKVTSSEN